MPRNRTRNRSISWHRKAHAHTSLSRGPAKIRPCCKLARYNQDSHPNKPEIRNPNLAQPEPRTEDTESWKDRIIEDKPNNQGEAPSLCFGILLMILSFHDSVGLRIEAIWDAI